MTLPTYRDIANTLIALTRRSNAAVARAANVQRPNLVNWLNGKEHALSLDKQLNVCAELGWHFGGLRRDVLHRFTVDDDLRLLKQVLACFDNEQPFSRVYAFPTEGRMAMHGAILMAKKEGESAPLVVLVSRQLASKTWEPLDAQKLQGGTAGLLHPVSDQEWLRWWRPKAENTDAMQYLHEYGNDMLEMIDWIEGMAVDPSVDEQLDDDQYAYRLPKRLTQQEADWLTLLAQALNQDQSFDEIVERTRQALSLK